MKYCEDYAALLDLYVDGELTPEEMAQVQTHLDTCPSCQSYVDDALAMRAAFPGAEETVVPEGFAESVMAAIQASNPPVKKKKGTPWVKVLAPLAACCAIVVLLQGGPMGAKKESAAPSAAYDMFSQSSSVTEAAAEESIEDIAVAETENDTADGQTGGAMPETELLRDALAAKTTNNEPLAAVPEMPVAPEAPAEMITADAAYASIVYLPAECRELLTDYEAALETEQECHYELSPAQWEAVAAQLADASFVYAAEDGISPTTDLVLVILSK